MCHAQQVGCSGIVLRLLKCLQPRQVQHASWSPEPSHWPCVAASGSTGNLGKLLQLKAPALLERRTHSGADKPYQTASSHSHGSPQLEPGIPRAAPVLCGARATHRPGIGCLPLRRRRFERGQLHMGVGR